MAPKPELPLIGAGSTLLGLGLWQHKPIALSSLTLLILVFTAVGMTVAPPPPSALAMAGSSVPTLVVVCALVGWFGRLPPNPSS